MSQPPQEVYEARLQQLRRDIGEIDTQSFVLAIISAMAEHEMKKGAERNSNGETIMEPGVNADEINPVEGPERVLALTTQRSTGLIIRSDGSGAALPAT